MKYKSLLILIFLSCQSSAMYKRFFNAREEYYGTTLDNDTTPIEIKIILKQYTFHNKKIKLLFASGDTIANVLEAAVAKHQENKKKQRLTEDFFLLPYCEKAGISYLPPFPHDLHDDIRYQIAFYKTTTFLLQKKR